MSINPECDDRLSLGDISLHYVRWGEQGKPVVCLHGLTANAFCFQAIADTLTPDHQVIAYDLRGRGESDKPASGYSVPIHAQDLAHVIDALHLERPVIIGHSLGALISLYFAAHYPDKLSKLVLIDAGAPLPWQTPEEQPAWLTAAVSRLGQPIFSYEEYRALMKQAPHLGPYWNEYIDIYISHDVQRNPDGSVTAQAARSAILEEGLHFYEAQPAQQWSHVEVPTLLLRAGKGLFSDNDQLLSEEAAEAVQRGIAQCHYVNYPTLNHYTIIFGVEDGPTHEIRNFIEEKE
ncbi:MAG TPA: alpha/beta hydrolase [Ktedonobacteraceae bacterium]